jgi:hypothetical protein
MDNRTRERCKERLSGGQRTREAQVCLMEVEFGLNPNIRELHDQLAKLSFADQIEVFYSGVGMWQHNVSSL